MIDVPCYEFDHSGFVNVGTGAVPIWLPCDGTNNDGVLNVLNADGSTEA